VVVRVVVVAVVAVVVMYCRVFGCCGLVCVVMFFCFM